MGRGRCGSGGSASGCVWMVFLSGLFFFVVLVEGSGVLVLLRWLMRRAANPRPLHKLPQLFNPPARAASDPTVSILDLRSWFGWKSTATIEAYLGKQESLERVGMSITGGLPPEKRPNDLL